MFPLKGYVDAERQRKDQRQTGSRARSLRLVRQRALAMAFVLLVVSGVISVGTFMSAKAATTLPSGFQETVALSGLNQPTAVRFSRDGRVFVAEKSGTIKVFDSLADPSPDVFADLNVNVHNFWDRGLLTLALDPQRRCQKVIFPPQEFQQERCLTPTGPVTQMLLVAPVLGYAYPTRAPLWRRVVTALTRRQPGFDASVFNFPQTPALRRRVHGAIA